MPGKNPPTRRSSLHYANGAKTYEMQQTIQPGDQMWVNLASLIRDRVPDRKGNILPSDTSFGTYDLHDLSLGLGSLMPGGLALDGTFGFRGAPPPYPPCCGTSSPDWGVDSFDLSIDDVSLDPIYATDTCNGDSENISGSFSDWWSGNTSIATVTNKAVTGVSAGTTTANASGVIFLDGCFEDPVQLQTSITVFRVTNVAPSPLVIGTSGAMAIGGSGFSSLQSPVSVTLSGTGVKVTNPSVTSDNLISATYSVASNAAAGSQSLVVSSSGSDGGQGANSNPFSVTITATPPIPVSASIDSNVPQAYANQTWTSCDGSQSTKNVYGYQNCVTYQVNDKNGNPIYQSLAITEALSVVDVGNINPRENGGNSSSNLTGQFQDDLALVGAAALQSNACFIEKQTITASGNSSPIRVNCLQFGSTSVTITDVTANPSSCSKPTYQCN